MYAVLEFAVRSAAFFTVTMHACRVSYKHLVRAPSRRDSAARPGRLR
jgi:hypothetical protein